MIKLVDFIGEKQSPTCDTAENCFVLHKLLHLIDLGHLGTLARVFSMISWPKIEIYSTKSALLSRVYKQFFLVLFYEFEKALFTV